MINAASSKKSQKKLCFVIHKHQATHLHYDLRLELEGVLKSFALPKEPSFKDGIKRLAIQVDDHDLSYKNFEGIIPKGSYGAGIVEIWDSGTYEPYEKTSHPENYIKEGLEKGRLSIILHGKKLKGTFTLIKLKESSKGNQWLLIKNNTS